MSRLRIKELAAQKGVTLKETAEAIGMKPASIYNLNNGAVKPSFDTMIKLKRYFGVQLDQLITKEPLPASLSKPETPQTSYVMEDQDKSNDLAQGKLSTATPAIQDEFSCEPPFLERADGSWVYIAQPSEEEILHARILRKLQRLDGKRRLQQLRLFDVQLDLMD